MITTHVGHHGNRGIDHVGRVPPPEQPDLDHRNVHRNVGEMAERGRRDQLEIGHRTVYERLEPRDRGDGGRELVVADRDAVDTDAFVDPLEMRAGVGTDHQTVSPQQLGDQHRGRTLAVGAGDMNDRVRKVGVAHHRNHRPDAVERKAFDTAGFGFQVDVRVEMTQGAVVLHSGAFIGVGGGGKRSQQSSPTAHEAARRGRCAGVSVRGINVGLTFSSTTSPVITTRSTSSRLGRSYMVFNLKLRDLGAEILLSTMKKQKRLKTDSI